MKYIIYLLINERKNKTYVGSTSDLRKRLKQHKANQVKSTKTFGDFNSIILEEIDCESKIRAREKYWKSSAGRKKIKALMGASSNG